MLEINDDQLNLMIVIVLTSPLFSVATIPVDNKDYPVKGEHYSKVANDVFHLESLGLVERVHLTKGEHKDINDTAERLTGYKYLVYQATKLGILMTESHVDYTEKELKHRNAIN